MFGSREDDELSVVHQAAQARAEGDQQEAQHFLVGSEAAHFHEDVFELLGFHRGAKCSFGFPGILYFLNFRWSVSFAKKSISSSK